MRFYLKRKRRLQCLVTISVISVGLLYFSCKEVPDSSHNAESELMIKINAVQQEIMGKEI
ncbi:hypothetical protein [Winogradskyella sp.]|uniref:hypothetical protein n=1 Tax=Winogradskyella sp. TaxID=1883156 RepID=UPI0035161891